MNRPFGVSVLGGLHVISGVFTLFATLMGFSFLTVGAFQNETMAGIGALGFVWYGILTAINWGVAGALFSRKSWGWLVVRFLAVIGLIIGGVSLAGGNMSAIFPMILNGIILWYMNKESVVKYFHGED